jgi:hypothetical protein
MALAQKGRGNLPIGRTTLPTDPPSDKQLTCLVSMFAAYALAKFTDGPPLREPKLRCLGVRSASRYNSLGAKNDCETPSTIFSDVSNSACGQRRSNHGCRDVHQSVLDDVGCSQPMSYGSFMDAKFPLFCHIQLSDMFSSRVLPTLRMTRTTYLSITGGPMMAVFCRPTRLVLCHFVLDIF